MDGWLAEQGKPRGYVASAQVIYEMSGEWYAGRLTEEWEPLGPDGAMELWSAHGLTGDFWSLA